MNELCNFGVSVMVGSKCSGSRSRQSVAAIWDNEYEKARSLPSTWLAKPSRCFSQLDDLLRWPGEFSVLDIGSGNGRHSLHFARMGGCVHALDVSGRAIEIATDLLSAHNISSRVRLHHGSAVDGLPSNGKGFDLILDSYMSCHLLDPIERANLLLSIHGALAPGGLFISLGVSLGDSFYAPHAGRTTNGCAHVCDPITGIDKLLTTEKFVVEEFAGLFDVERVGRLEMTDPMSGVEFRKEAIYVAARATNR